MPGDSVAVQEFSDDPGYFGWLAAHPAGYVLSVRRRGEPLLHRATCTHVDRHNHPGALTGRGTRKLCADSKDDLRAWATESGLGPGGDWETCASCAP